MQNTFTSSNLQSSDLSASKSQSSDLSASRSLSYASALMSKSTSIVSQSASSVVRSPSDPTTLQGPTLADPEDYFDPDFDVGYEETTTVLKALTASSSQTASKQSAKKSTAIRPKVRLTSAATNASKSTTATILQNVDSSTSR